MSRRPQEMTAEHQQLFANVLRDCLGLEPLYSDVEAGLAPRRHSMHARRAAAAKQQAESVEGEKEHV